METQEYKRILVGIDGSDQAQAAFKQAVEVARRNKGKVYIAIVIDQQVYNLMGYSSFNQELVEKETDEARSLLKDCVSYAQKEGGVAAEGIISFGSAKVALARQLPEKYEIDLIMVGQSGLNAVERFVMGSVSSYIIRQAPCDVLIVRSHGESPQS